ncbi:hypothetical protein B0H14DRAFT_2951620 [Mycena olivaceomarginata]|nr:hypothetical protein B0H14DRAFT_2951620 [Mycena olivaceomarginata]
MTRHTGGAAAHLLSPRRLSPCTICVVSCSVSKSPGTSQSNPLHVPPALHDPPKCVPHRVPHAVPIVDLNPSHAPRPPEPRSVPDAVPIAGLNRSRTPPAAIVHLRHIPSPEPTFESNPPHFPPVEHLPSPPLYLPVPIHDSRPHLETPSNSTPRLDNAFILQIFDCLILSLSWHCALAELIDAIDLLTVDADITTLEKRVRERYKTSILPI